jgi:dymeclin
MSPLHVQAGTDITEDAAAAEARLLPECLQALLEVVDTLLYRTLPKNADLVYSLLHRQEVLEGLAAAGIWSDPDKVLHNVRAVVGYFTAAIDGAASTPRAGGASGSLPQVRGEGAGVGGGDWSVDRVRRIISERLLTWRQGLLRPVPELKFSYEEAQGAQEFFLPYLWTLIMQHACVALPAPSRDCGF